MSSGALFPSMVSGTRGNSSKYLVEFRAGKMTLKGNVVTPDKRKGTVYVQQSDDSLIHFCWKDRTSGNVDDVSNCCDAVKSNFSYRALSLRLKGCSECFTMVKKQQTRSYKICPSYSQYVNICMHTTEYARTHWRCDGVSLLLLQDLIIFPDDCEFKKVSQCTTGRVYVLKFKAGSKRLFFWMQVRGSYCNININVIINHLLIKHQT